MKNYLTQLLLVGMGGFVGSAARFAVGGLVLRLFPRAAFPYGTLSVNILGCLMIGFVRIGGTSDVFQVPESTGREPTSYKRCSVNQESDEEPRYEPPKAVRA